MQSTTRQLDTSEIMARSHWRRRLILGLLLLMAMFAAVVGWSYWKSRSALRDAMAEAERTDPHWRIDDLEAHRTPVKDDENSALVIAAAKLMIDNSLGVKQREDENSRELEDLRRYPAAGLDEAQRRAISELMRPYRPALDQYRKIINMPRGRFPLKYSKDFIGTMINSQDAREGSRLFQLLVCDRIAEQDVEGAFAAVKGMINAARSVGDEPLLISILIRIACEAVAVNRIEWFLAQCQPTEAMLGELQAMLEEDQKIQLLTLGLRGERAGNFEIFEHMKDNPGSLKTLGVGDTGTNLLEYLLTFLPGQMTVQQADALRMMNQAVAASKLPDEQQIDAITDLSKMAPKLSLMARLLFPALEKVTQASIRRQAQLQCAIVAIAAERFRIKNGRWPNQIEELVAAGLLPKNPVDAFDGKPLRWKVIEHGRLIYSVGKDRVDNNGHFDPDMFQQDGYDMGFRLFDANLRGKMTRPPKPDTKHDGPPSPP